MHFLELKIPPLLLTAIAMTLIVVAGLWFPTANLPFPGHRALAVALFVLGLCTMFAGAIQFRLMQTTLDPRDPSKSTRIVTHGIYRFTRNPMYLGMAFMLAGVAAWPANLFGLAVTVLFCLYLTEMQIKPEERFLLQQFGDEFGEYMARVRRWL
jgi:protein-S-isoprenylcysteine O-methyltransferase Ste14